MSRAKTASVIDTIDSMLASIDARVGSEKAAEANTEAGGYEGPTTHPVKKVDDGTEPAQEGARSQENEEDVKKDQGPPSVDSTPENPSVDKSAAGDQDKVQLNIGTRQSATGEDPSIETASVKHTKEDGGYQGPSSHPARTDNDEIDGHKYSSVVQQLRRAIKEASELGNEALAAIAVEAQDDIKKQAQSQLKNRGVDLEKTAMCEECGKEPCECKGKKDKEAAGAGKALADAVTQDAGQVDGHDKQAEAAQVVEDLAQTIVTAYGMADKTAAYLQDYFETLQKLAEEDAGDGGEETPPEAKKPSGDEPPAGDADEAAILAALLGGAGGSPEAGPEMGGEVPPTGDVPGAEEAVADMGGGEPGVEGGDDELAMLEAALAEAGIPPEALEAQAAAKAAAALKQKRAEKEAAAKKPAWRPKTAEQARRYQATLNYIRELCGQK